MLAFVALVVGPIGYAANGTDGLVDGLRFGLFLGLGLGLALGLFLGLFLGLGAGLGGGLGTGFIGRLGTGFIGGLGAGLDLGLGTGLGIGLGVFLYPRLQVAFRDVPNLWPYLRLIGRPLLGYALAYAALVMWFASVYAALYRWIGYKAFASPFPPHFGDFLFFAITIFPPIGAYSDLKPLAPLAQIIVAGELIAGVGYTTVLFAAILAYLTPRFAEEARKQNNEPSTEKMITDLKTDLCRAQEQTHKDLSERMARIERQLGELAKQRTSADAQSANRQTRQPIWRRLFTWRI